MTAAEKIVAEALFGNDQIKGEPDNYYLHREQFLAAVERAINEERERCVKIALRHGWDEAFGKDAAHEIADDIRAGETL